jgi:hypothetical protein
MDAQESTWNTEAPAVIRIWDQSATRESQAGPFGVTVMLVVPMKPANAGGGKGPWLETYARSEKEKGIGDEPDNPGKYSEVTYGVTRQGEEIA